VREFSRKKSSSNSSRLLRPTPTVIDFHLADNDAILSHSFSRRDQMHFGRTNGTEVTRLEEASKIAEFKEKNR